MPRKKYSLSSWNDFLTREQVVAALGRPRQVVDRLIATGRLTQYRIGPGIGRGGQRVFYTRTQVERVKAELSARRRR